VSRGCAASFLHALIRLSARLRQRRRGFARPVIRASARQPDHPFRRLREKVNKVNKLRRFRGPGGFAVGARGRPPGGMLDGFQGGCLW